MFQKLMGENAFSILFVIELSFVIVMMLVIVLDIVSIFLVLGYCWFSLVMCMLFVYVVVLCLLCSNIAGTEKLIVLDVVVL